MFGTYVCIVTIKCFMFTLCVCVCAFTCVKINFYIESTDLCVVQHLTLCAQTVFFSESVQCNIFTSSLLWAKTMTWLGGLITGAMKYSSSLAVCFVTCYIR